MKLSMETVKQGGKMALSFLEKHEPILLSSLAAGGVISTAILSGKAAVKASRQMEAKEKELGRPLTKKETVRLVWKTYLPPTLVGSASIGSIFISNRVSTKRLAAMSVLYEASKNTLTEYQKKVVDTIGEKKEAKIREGIKQDKVDHSTENNTVIVTSNGSTWCQDSFTGRLFTSDYDYIRHIVNDLNADLIRSDFISLNEFYYAVGLDGIKTGDEIGWNMAREGLIDIRYSSVLSSEGRPCLYLEYNVGPYIKYGDA